MRLFLAIELSARTRGGLERFVEGARRSSHGWRWVPIGNVHLTLRFLGETAPELDRAGRPVWRAAAAAAAPMVLRICGTGRFPPRGAARIFWVGIDARQVRTGLDPLARLADELERGARELGFPPETRPFRPHLTLARAARDARRPRGPEGEPDPIEEMAEELVLFRSELRPDGARYRTLERFPLGGRPDRGDVR